MTLTDENRSTGAGEELVPVPLCAPQIPHELPRLRTRPCVICGGQSGTGTKVNLNYITSSPYRAVNTLRLCYTNQPVNAV